MPPTMVRTKTISALHSRGLSESNDERYLLFPIAFYLHPNGRVSSCTSFLRHSTRMNDVKRNLDNGYKHSLTWALTSSENKNVIRCVIDHTSPDQRQELLLLALLTEHLSCKISELLTKLEFFPYKMSPTDQGHGIEIRLLTIFPLVNQGYEVKIFIERQMKYTFSNVDEDILLDVQIELKSSSS